MRRSGRALFAAALFLFSFALSAVPALGATARTSGSVLRFVAGANEQNKVTITFDAGTSTYTVRDVGVPAVQPGAGCGTPNPADPQTVSCPDPGAAIRRMSVSLKDQNDHATVMPAIAGRLSGGAGGDVLVAGAGSQQLSGGSGDDVLEGGPGSDRISGGPGILDLASYEDHSSPVMITMGSGSGNDGNADDLNPTTGRLDVLSGSIEGAIGGSAADTLTGSTKNDQLFGGPGDDILVGKSGSDLLDGGAGADQLTTDDTGSKSFPGDSLIGGPGDDFMQSSIGRDLDDGGPGEDTIDAGPGDDHVIGGEGPDTLNGGAGNDFVMAADMLPPADHQIMCGDGAMDVAFVDALDVLAGVVSPDCEQVNTAP